ncbi:cyclase family protein [Bacillus sp. B15-48]|uniref:cyclase family protein n=1 Tax=Bacillus sp. B15-48 TaxID=1548601 RepID=UPI00193FA350|nr:hypothetical protein [Bacillus sp. B15-48]
MDYPSPKISYFQRHATNGIVSQFIETPLHTSTHLDAEMHGISGGKDIASIPLERLVREGVTVDISDEVEDFTVIEPEMITKKMDVKEGDILLIHTVGIGSTTVSQRKMRFVTSVSILEQVRVLHNGLLI